MQDPLALLGAVLIAILTFWGTIRERKKSVSIAVAAEIRSIMAMSRINGLEEHLKHLGDVSLSVENSKFPRPSTSTDQSYFTVYEENAVDIGRLEPQKVIKIVMFYQRARNCLDAINHLSDYDFSSSTPEEVSYQYHFLADTVKTLFLFGEALIDELVASSMAAQIRKSSDSLSAF
ncbi:hypothetical protein [Sphingomonas sp. CFBP9019]|uniref:hypothetical protein n=1 Tax=Sphingomonas sp. CFBP9019 TaxID=3096532 RepID=UPI002A6A64BB|nr:hypothetical protein [Sphingomonas sp. CFBP9019]MDY1008796.1 hypothetical protein [Sphingomonas sp. CFBP9019]